jgi:flagellar hook-length control protein FliK
MSTLAALPSLPPLPQGPSTATAGLQPAVESRLRNAAASAGGGFARTLGALRGSAQPGAASGLPGAPGAAGAAAAERPHGRAADTETKDEPAPPAQGPATDDAVRGEPGGTVAIAPSAAPPLAPPGDPLRAAGTPPGAAAAPAAAADSADAAGDAAGADRGALGATSGTAAGIAVGLGVGGSPRAHPGATSSGNRTAPGAGRSSAADSASAHAAGGPEGVADSTRSLASGATSRPDAAGSAAALPRPGDSFAAALAAATPATTPAAIAPSPAPATPQGAAPAAEAMLSSPPGGAAFAGELAARVTTFVRDGFEQARLQLNPAEMGPVDVRIQIDGDGARIVFAADQASTRQWLEQALPTLAGSLREAGLTLAGGGVFERGAHDPGSDDRPAGGSASQQQDGGARAGTDDARPLPPATALRRRGVVDLVA